MILINTKISKHSIFMVIIYLIYRMVLDFIYIIGVSPTFGYMGFVNNSSFLSLLISYILLLPLIFMIPKDEKKVSNLVMQLHFIVMIVPLTVLYAFLNKYESFLIMCLSCFMLQLIIIRNMSNIKMIKISNSKLLFWSVINGLSAITYLYVIVTQNLNLNGFGAENIYSIRAEQEINSTLFSYLIPWQYRIINPLMMIYFFVKKKYSGLAGVVGLQFLLFLYIPHKEIILSIVLIFLILLIDKFEWKFDYIFTIFLTFTTIVSYLIFSKLGDLNLFGSVPVRLLYLPAEIKYSHYDFFSKNEKLYYSEGLIGRIFGLDYPYSLPSGYLIGNNVINENTGYLAYAYDNAGFIGMIIMSILFIIVIKTVDSLTDNRNVKTVFALICYPMIILNDGDLLTLLLTGGFILILLVLLIQEDIGLFDRPNKINMKY